MKVACNLDNTNSILSSVVQHNFAQLGLRLVGVINDGGIDKANSILSSAVPCQWHRLGCEQLALSNLKTEK